MFSIVRSELTKVFTLRSAWLVICIILLLNAVIIQIQLPLYTDAMAKITPDGMIELFDGQSQSAASLVWDLTTWPLQIGIFCFVIGALIAGAEFRQGHLGVSVLAVPSRLRLICAKTIATALVALGVGIVLTLTSAAYMYVVVKDWNPALLWELEAFAGYGRFQLFIVAFTMVGFALTLIARRTLTGIIVCGLMLGLTMTQVVSSIAPGVDALIPTSAGRNLLVEPGFPPPLTASPEHGAIVLIVWAIATVAVAAWMLHRRDAR